MKRFRSRIWAFVGGPLDGETHRIPRCRKFVHRDGEKRHVYRPSGEPGVWSYDLEASALATIEAAIEQRRGARAAEGVA